MFKPEGVFTALITPMNTDETIHHQELRNQVERQLAAEAAGLFCMGTNGEFYALSSEERLTSTDIIIEQLNNRVPLIINIGCVTTQETIRLAKLTAKKRVDALSIIAPYYASLSQKQLYDHFAAVAHAVDIPVMVYNIPQRTGNAVSVETVEKLSHIDNVIGIKDSSGNVAHLDELLTLKSEEFSLLIGTDSLILETLIKGATGAVAGCANPFPQILNGIYDNWKKGNLARAQQLQASIVPFRQTFSLSNPNSIVKRSVELLGYPVGPARSPANIADPFIDAHIHEAIKKVELLAQE